MGFTAAGAKLDEPGGLRSQLGYSCKFMAFGICGRGLGRGLHGICLQFTERRVLSRDGPSDHTMQSNSKKEKCTTKKHNTPTGCAFGRKGVRPCVAEAERHVSGQLSHQ